MTPIHDPNTIYFCVDIEASGPVPALYNMVSIAGVEVRLDGERHRRGDHFYFEIAPMCDGFDPSAMAIHGLTEAHLREHGRPAKEVMAAITEFVKARTSRRKRALFVGHNAPFDWMYVAWYFQWAGVENPFGYDPLDTKALMMGRHGTPWSGCNKKAMLSRYPGLQAPRPEDEHNALVDAEFQADLLICLLDGAIEAPA
ncbi:MAG: 3'-5' exonuclease [Myxococcales bacterium]|nr:3'-5' exonuclease [Myxococcales bacterium]